MTKTEYQEILKKNLVFLDRMKDLSSLAFLSELRRIADPEEREAAEF